MCINIFSFCSKGYSKTLIHNRWKRNKFHYLTATLIIASWIANVRYSQYLRKFWKPAEMLNCQDLVFSFNFQFHHQRLVKILQLNYQLELPFSLNFKTGLRVALHKYARIRVFPGYASTMDTMAGVFLWISRYFFGTAILQNNCNQLLENIRVNLKSG